MIMIVFLLIALSAFLSGFICGSGLTPQRKSVKKPKAEFKSEILSKEYENFLNYDGSEQI